MVLTDLMNDTHAERKGAHIAIPSVTTHCARRSGDLRRIRGSVTDCNGEAPMATHKVATARSLIKSRKVHRSRESTYIHTLTLTDEEQKSALQQGVNTHTH
jgi:hypothetical protein